MARSAMVSGSSPIPAKALGPNESNSSVLSQRGPTCRSRLHSAPVPRVDEGPQVLPSRIAVASATGKHCVDLVDQQRRVAGVHNPVQDAGLMFDVSIASLAVNSMTSSSSVLPDCFSGDLICR